MVRKTILALCPVMLIAFAVPAGVFAAGANDQPVEFMMNRLGRPTYSLSYIGYGKGAGPKCDSFDYVFRINGKSPSVNNDLLRIYAQDTAINNAFRGTSPIGHELNTYSPYLCLGTRNVLNAGGPMLVQLNLFAWLS